MTIRDITNEALTALLAKYQAMQNSHDFSVVLYAHKMIETALSEIGRRAVKGEF